MDLKVAWSPEAIEDVESIAEYIGRDSDFYARAVATKIIEIGRSIERFPWVGRIVPELGDERIRERFVYSYRVIYQVQESRSLIVAVIHGKRLIESITDRLAGLG
jgi:plasmid stabilization system protein ParE